MTPSRLRRVALLPYLFAISASVAVGCGDDGPGRSTVVGTIDQASFPYPATRILTSSSDGMKSVTPVAADGTFAIELDKKRHYTLTVDTDLGSYPLVLGGAHGQYALEVLVRGGGAYAELGQVRFYDPAEAPYAATQTCVEGYYEDSLEPCIATNAQVSCRSKRHGDDDHHGGRDRGDEQHGEHDDDFEDDDVAPHGPLVTFDAEMAVPTYALPASIGCKGEHGDDDDGDEDDDGWDDDGWDEDDDGWGDDD